MLGQRVARLSTLAFFLNLWLLEQTQKTNRLRLAPAERAEILVDVSDGKMPILQHKVGKKNPVCVVWG